MSFLNIESASSDLILKSAELHFTSLPTDYYFFVNVSRKNYSNISPPFKIHLIPGSPPKVFVECVTNCDFTQTQNSEDSVRLRFSCDNCLERETLVSIWSLAYILDSSQSIRIDASQNETIYYIDDNTVEFPSEVIYSRNGNQIATVITVSGEKISDRESRGFVYVV